MDVELEDLTKSHVPELPTTSAANEIDEWDFLAARPLSDSYETSFRNHTVFIDSVDWRNLRLLQFQIVLAFFIFIVFGLSDQTIGTIIPKLQEHYHINDVHTAIIFLALTFGYFSMAFMSGFLSANLGFQGVGVLGAMCMVLAYLVISLAPPFWLYVLCYVFSGFGFGSLDAAMNGWMGGLVDSNQLLGILHGCYGIGCTISPPVITRLMTRKNNPWAWNDYYLVLSVCSAIGLLLVSFSFKYETPAKYAFSIQLNQARKRSKESDEIEDDHLEDDSESATLAQSLSSSKVWAFSLIMFFYVGAEVAFGEWLVTFLTRIRHVSYKMSSYMATTFWLGLTGGRIGLGFITAHYFRNELNANWVYIGLLAVGYVVYCAIAFTPMVFLQFVVVFLTGVFVGPIFPTTITSSIRILPARFHASAVGFICAFGGGGGAAIPTLIGFVAEKSDLGLALFPFIITAVFIILAIAWLVIRLRYTQRHSL